MSVTTQLKINLLQEQQHLQQECMLEKRRYTDTPLSCCAPVESHVGSDPRSGPPTSFFLDGFTGIPRSRRSSTPRTLLNGAPRLSVHFPFRFVWSVGYGSQEAAPLCILYVRRMTNGIYRGKGGWAKTCVRLSVFPFPSAPIRDIHFHFDTIESVRVCHHIPSRPQSRTSTMYQLLGTRGGSEKSPMCRSTARKVEEKV